MGRPQKGVRLASSFCLTIWIDKVGGFTWFGSWNHPFPLPEASVCTCLSCSSLLTKAKWTGVPDTFGLQLVDSGWIVPSSLYTGGFRFFSFKNLFQLHSFIYVCVHVHMCVFRVEVRRQFSGVSSLLPGIFFHMGSRNQTQVLKLGWTSLWPYWVFGNPAIFSVSNSVHYGKSRVPEAQDWFMYVAKTHIQLGSPI